MTGENPVTVPILLKINPTWTIPLGRILSSAVRYNTGLRNHLNDNTQITHEVLYRGAKCKGPLQWRTEGGRFGVFKPPPPRNAERYRWSPRSRE